MGDRVSVDVNLYGRVTSPLAMADILEAISTDLGQDIDELAQTVIDFLHDPSAKAPPCVNFNENEVNYADVSSIVASAVEHKIDLEVSWGSGYEFDGGSITIIAGQTYNALGEQASGIDVDTIRKLLKEGGQESLEEYLRAIEGVDLQPFRIAPEVREVLDRLADGEEAFEEALP